MKQKTIGLALVGTVCASQVGSALTSQIAVRSLNAPFFLMWIHTLMMALMWPLGLAVETTMVVFYNNNIHNRNRNRNSGEVRREHVALIVQEARRKVPRMLCLIVLLFYPLWIVANYCYVAALKYVPASTMVSIFGSCTAFVSIGERIWLQKPCTIVRVFAVLLAVCGVIAYGVIESGNGSGSSGTSNNNNNEEATAKNDNNNTLLVGVLLGTCSSIAAAMYKVAFKKFLGSPSTIDVCLFLSVLGIVNGVIGAIPTVVLAHAGAETPFYHSNLTASSWGIIWGGSILILIFNASIAFGIAVTSPLFIAVGTVLTIPVTDAIDYFWVSKGETLVAAGQITASAAIVASFVFIAVFDRHSVVSSEEDVLVGNRNDDEELLPVVITTTTDEEDETRLFSGSEFSDDDDEGDDDDDDDQTI